MPDKSNDIGPQDEAERHLYGLVMAGLNSGTPQELSVADLITQLRARVPAVRAKNAD